MKKILAGFVLTAFVFVGASAQEMTNTATSTSFGIRAGVNFQNINGKNALGQELEHDLLTGFHAGVNAEIPVGTGSYLQPGVLYSRKGAKTGDNSSIRLSYIEVPVNFVYKPVLSTGNLLLGFGPYVAWGINGKLENGNSETDIDFDSEYNALDASTQFKRFDAGANFLAGYEFANNLSFQINAQLGLLDINKDSNISDDETRWRNTGFGLSLGFRF